MKQYLFTLKNDLCTPIGTYYPTADDEIIKLSLSGSKTQNKIPHTKKQTVLVFACMRECVNPGTRARVCGGLGGLECNTYCGMS